MNKKRNLGGKRGYAPNDGVSRIDKSFVINEVIKKCDTKENRGGIYRGSERAWREELISKRSLFFCFNSLFFYFYYYYRERRREGIVRTLIESRHLLLKRQSTTLASPAKFFFAILDFYFFLITTLNVLKNLTNFC